MVDDSGGNISQSREIAQILSAFQQEDHRKNGGIAPDQRVPERDLLCGGGEVFCEFAGMGNRLETRVGRSFYGGHRGWLLCRMWRMWCQSVPYHQAACDERNRGEESEAQSSLQVSRCVLR